MNHPRVVCRFGGFRVVRLEKRVFAVEIIDHDHMGKERWVERNTISHPQDKPLDQWLVVRILETMSRRRRRRTKR